MKVYCVFHTNNIDFDEMIEIYSTKEKAEAESCNGEYHDSYVVEWEVK